jgi:tetratricopeptide (TPR) repeat protein
MRARIAEDEEPASALEKLAEVVGEHVTDDEERRFVEPRLRHLLGLEESARFERDDLFAAWRLFFERLADVYPVVMVFEDMQWADTALLDFIEYLLEWSRSSPLFVMTLARPELLDRRPTWGAASRSLTSIYLEPLPEPAMEELLDGLVPGLPEATRRQILGRAEGIPLYAVETVRMLLDRGVVVQEGAVYRPTGTIEALEVPETLHALIAARLDGLSPEERRMVQDAAVLGKTFTKSALAALAGRPKAELEPLLASLVRKEVLSVQADPRSPERGQYGFLQDLLKRVAYETLSKKERRARHLAAAEHLEQAFASDAEIVEVVASHFVAAYEAAPDGADAAEIKQRAVELLARAAERAASLAAADEAQRYFEQAAELADDALQRARMRERSGEMAWMRGSVEEAQPFLEEAMALFEQQGQTHAAARVSARLGVVEWRRGQLVPAIERMEQAYGVLANDEPDQDLATLAAQLGRLYWFRGDTERAAERVETGLEIAETLWLPEVVAEALVTKGIVADTRGRTEESLALLKHGLDVARDYDIPSAATRAYFNLGDTLARRDRYEEALDTFRSGIALAQRIGDSAWGASARGEVSYLLAMTGAWAEALEEAEALVEEAESIGAGYYISLLNIVPELLVPRGSLDKAKSLLERFTRFESSDDVQERCTYAAAQAAILQAEGSHAAALEAAERAIEGLPMIGAAAEPVKAGLVEALEAALALGNLERADELLTRIDSLRPRERTPYLQAHSARFRARIGASADDHSVDQGFKSASAIFLEYGIPFWRAVTQLEHAEWLGTQVRTAEAEPLAVEARATFDRLGAVPWFERASRLGAEVPA